MLVRLVLFVVLLVSFWGDTDTDVPGVHLSKESVLLVVRTVHGTMVLL